MKKILFGLLAVALTFVGCGNTESAKEMISVKGMATEVALNGLDGKTFKVTRSDTGFRFEGYEGKAVLLAFFATWCPPCKAEIPHLKAITDKHKDSFAVVAVTIEADKPKAELEAFAKEHGINYQVAFGKTNEEMIRAVGGVRGVPNMFLYASSGKLLQHYTGAVPAEMIEEDLRKAGVIK
jgi:thiol-disulfide isomerase/thioredoxin